MISDNPGATMQRAARLVLATSLAILLCFQINSAVRADVATADEMNQVCDNWLSLIVHDKGEWAGSKTPMIASVQPMVVDGELVANVYWIEPGGYVVVPVLKALPPVKASSDECRLDPNETGGMAALLREILAEANEIYVYYYGSLDAPLPKADDNPFGREYRDRWDSYAVSREQFQSHLNAKDRDTLVSVGPLLTCHWHQGDPYYNFCPWGDGGRCVVGCVATAAAQILDYHQWPPYGVGTFTYYWFGDQSCDGSTPGMYLTVNLDDNYDWPHITDYTSPSGPPVEKDAVAELCYEVGVAYRMHYGHCGSGAYVQDAQTVLPNYFHYKNGIIATGRSGLTKAQWFAIAVNDIDDSLPISYGITYHAIVCDGYRIVDGNNQMHFNYGWNSSHSTWYTVDYLYCPWEGCANGDQIMLTRIIPDKDILFYIDTTVGYVPLQVSVNGYSELAVDQWVYDFGDGDSAFTQSASHIYDVPGNYDISLRIQAGDSVRTFTREKVIVAIADTLTAPTLTVAPDSQVVVNIYARNSAPVSEFKLPIDYMGDCELALYSFSVAGCRTEYFEVVEMIHCNPNGQATFKLKCSDYGTADPLPAGAGPILKLFLSAAAGAGNDEVSEIKLGGYSSYEPTFYSPVLTYSPAVADGSITSRSCCVGARGNVNNDADDNVDISDLVHLVNYMFASGAEPGCWREADVNASGAVDITDLIYLVSYMFSGTYPPLPCP